MSPVAVANPPILEMRGVDMRFRLGGLGKRVGLQALSGVSLSLEAGRALALVGESGSGKSTCARLLARVYRPQGGEIVFRGVGVNHLSGRELTRYRADVQMIFQDPFGSLNPTQSVAYILERPLRIHRPKLSRREVSVASEALLAQVGLVPATEFMKRRPHELSGGQRQRVAIARALSVEPAVLLADEPTSMLDVSVRLGILNLLQELKSDRNLASLYITHDIATARYFAEDIAVMYAGHVVEHGPSDAITGNPRHPYTQLLIESVPDPRRKITGAAVRRAAEIPVWTAGSRGCPFVSRCPRGTQICRETMPGPTPVGPGHTARCHHL